MLMLRYPPETPIMGAMDKHLYITLSCLDQVLKWMDSVRGKEGDRGSWGNWEYGQIKTNRDYQSNRQTLDLR